MRDDQAVTPEDLRAYASVVAGIAAGHSVDDAATEAGLTREAYDVLDRRVDAALGRAMAASGQAPAPFLVEYERALRDAHQRARPARRELPVEELMRALIALGSGTDPQKALEAMGLDAAAVVRAATQHAPTLARDPALAARLAQLFTAARKKT